LYMDIILITTVQFSSNSNIIKDVVTTHVPGCITLMLSLSHTHIHTCVIALTNRQHLSYDVCLEVRGEIIRTVLCCIVY